MTPRAAVALASLWLVACDPAPPERIAGPAMMPVVRFVDDGPSAPAAPAVPGLLAAVGDERRPALTAVAPVALTTAWRDPAPAFMRTLRAELPADAHAVPVTFLTVSVLVDGQPLTLPALAVPSGPDVAATDLTIPMGRNLAQERPVRVTALLAPELERRDVVTRPVVVPAGAVLALAAGVQDGGWSSETPPLEFTITALDDGGERVLSTTRLDPAHVQSDRAWRELAVPLGQLAGRTVRFRFATRTADPRRRAAAVPVWGDPTLLAPVPGRGDAFNIVLISLDTLRAASVSAYGCARPTTPVFDARVAGEGVLFEAAYAAVPNTLPSHMSLFTGLYPMHHGVMQDWQVLDPVHRLLAERFRAAGWQTAAFTEDGLVVAGAGFERGFGTYWERHGEATHEPTANARETFGRGLAWLRDHADRPFFLFLHTYQVHAPYTPPLPYSAAFGDAPSDVPAAGDLLRYEQEVRLVDDVLGEVLDALDLLGLSERTVLVVTADHGEEFLEHGQRFHDGQVYAESVQVPLAMRLPGALPAGRRVPVQVSLVDLVPTLLELTGLPPADGDGVSLVPLLVGDASPRAERPVFSQPLYGTDAAIRTPTLTCLSRGLPAFVECYDRLVDPGEHDPLPLAGDAVTAALARLAEYRVQLGGSVVAPTRADAVDPEHEQRLRALGYVQ